MRMVVMGSGLMGPAAAYNAVSDPDVSRVLLCDARPEQIEAARERLARLGAGGKLETAVVDLRDQAAAVRLLSGFDVALGALPRPAIPLGIRAAAAARLPLIDLNWPPDRSVAALRAELESAGVLYVPGCGLEPGLTEVLARFLAEKLDRVDELHIKCGGIPAKPAPPLGYKIVFGGRELPLRDVDARVVENGALKPVPRYSGAEPVIFEGVGTCEAWHEGFMPWLLDLPALEGLRIGTQKTVRWPGYAERVTALRDMGLLSDEPVEVDGARVVPKHVVDAVLYECVRLEEGEHDLVVLRVEACGAKDGRPRRYRVDMVDRYDERRGLTAMARSTSFTGAIVARMVGRGEIGGGGWRTPEQLIAGPLFERLIDELREQGIAFTLTAEYVENL